jgi:hypothetical protein
MELLAGNAYETVRKGQRGSKFNQNSYTPPPNESKTTVSSHKSSKNISVDDVKNISTFDPQVIVEKSEVDSNGPSSPKSTPKETSIKQNSGNTDQTQLSNRKDYASNSGKAFVKKDNQYFIEEITKDPSSTLQSVDSYNGLAVPGYIQEIQEVEEVLFEIQNNYTNLDLKVKDQISKFTNDMNNKFNELLKSVEFTNNQMNVYFQMMNTDIDIIKKSKMY